MEAGGSSVPAREAACFKHSGLTDSGYDGDNLYSFISGFWAVELPVLRVQIS
jgi:hypothetical protein